MSGKVGRPKGYRVSAETRSAIAQARRDRAVLRRMGVSPPSCPPSQELGGLPGGDVPLEVRLAVARRDAWKCRMCHTMYLRVRRDRKGNPLKDKDDRPIWTVNTRADIHVVAIDRYDQGGDPEDPMNHVLACYPCRRNMALMGTRAALEGVWPPIS